MFVEAFEDTMNHYKLSATEIALKTGLRNATISDFRNRRVDIKLSTLVTIIDGLPEEARTYFLCRSLLAEIREEQIGTILMAIADQLRKTHSTTKKELVII